MNNQDRSHSLRTIWTITPDPSKSARRARGHWLGAALIFFNLHFLILSFPLNGMAAFDEDLRIFTEKDMAQLAQKIGTKLHKCKQLHKRPDVIVDVQNKTADFFDKTKFSALIHGQLEGKTHAAAETKPPQFEIRAQLENEKKVTQGLTRSKYTITAQVFQAEEKLCEKSASISKRYRSGSAGLPGAGDSR